MKHCDCFLRVGARRAVPLMCYLTILFFTSCAQGNLDSEITRYIDKNPQTLVVVAQALKDKCIIEDMNPKEVELLLGEPIGKREFKEKGQRKYIATYSRDCRFQFLSEICEIQAPVAVEYIRYEMNSQQYEYRVVNVWSILR